MRPLCVKGAERQKLTTARRSGRHGWGSWCPSFERGVKSCSGWDEGGGVERGQEKCCERDPGAAFVLLSAGLLGDTWPGLCADLARPPRSVLACSVPRPRVEVTNCLVQILLSQNNGSKFSNSNFNFGSVESLFQVQFLRNLSATRTC